MKLSLSIFIFFASIVVHGQINHYWTNQFGAKSTLLGGAVVGNVRDNSSIFYNPGGLAFIENSSISIDGDAVYLDIIKHENAAGDGLDLQNTAMELIPSALSGTVKDKKRPWLTLNYAILNRNVSRTTFNAKYSGIDDVMSGNPGDENYLGTYSFSDETREDWVILGRGYRVNERLGIGISTVVSFLSQTQSEKYNISTYVEGNEGEVNELGYNINETDLKYNNVGLMFKFGWSYQFDKLRIGGNITTPRVSIYAVSKAYLNRNNQVSVPPFTENPKKKAVNVDKVNAQYKSPWSIDMGASYPIGKKGIAYLTVAYFSKIDKYNQLKGDLELNEPEEVLQPNENDFSAVFQAHKAIVNIAVGFEYLLNDHFSVLTGFRTDFNYVDATQLDQDYGYVPTFSNYDLYHASAGVHYTNKKIAMNLGLITGFGSSKNNQQLVDLTDPKDENLLLGGIDNNVNSSFLRVGLLVGVTYSFLSSE
jgi:hypothetical protein